MLTAVMLLLLPAVLGMSIFRIVQIPQGLLSRRLRINPRALCVAALGFGITYCALLGCTILVLYTAAKAMMSPPRTIQELLSVASVAAAYPFVYLAFEWVLYHSVKPTERA